MARPTFKRGQMTERRRKLVADLLVRGVVDQREIQRMLSLPAGQGGIANPDTGKPYSLGTINGDVQWVKAQWLEEAQHSSVEYLARELAEVDAVAEQAWRQWQASMQRERIIVKTTQEEGSTETVVTTRERLLPDRGYLETVLECVSKRSRMLGLDKGDGVTVGVGVNVSQQVGKGVDVIEVREYLGE